MTLFPLVLLILLLAAAARRLSSARFGERAASLLFIDAAAIVGGACLTYAVGIEDSRTLRTPVAGTNGACACPRR